MSRTRRPRALLVAGLCSLALACGSSTPATLAAQLCHWEDHPGNPLIEPPPGESLVGDPTLLTPAEAPDGRWHLFANSLLGLQHYTSTDGLAFTQVQRNLFGPGSFRPFIFQDGGRYHLFFESFLSLGLDRSEVRRSESTDLVTFSEPVTVLAPELAWEVEGGRRTLGNPSVSRRDGRYWLYYSASGVLLPDVNFYEPRYVGLARADSLAGPWTRETEPILRPSAGDALANMGAGSFKLLDDSVGTTRLALQNGIYNDGAGHSRSAIRVLSSTDGLHWSAVCDGAVVAPGGSGWKSAFVYAFDTARVGDELRVYFNAREGWTTPGIERIGMARLRWPKP